MNLRTCPQNGECAAEELAVLAGGLDNFEGMTHLGDRRVLIVSDWSGKAPLTTTLLLLTLP